MALSCNLFASVAGPPKLAKKFTASVHRAINRPGSLAPPATERVRRIHTPCCRIPRPVSMQHMQTHNLTSLRRLRSFIDAECSTRDTIPRRQVSPRAEEIERAFAGHRRLWLGRPLRKNGICGCDELRGACLERLGGSCDDECWFGPSWCPSRVSDTGLHRCGSHKSREGWGE